MAAGGKAVAVVLVLVMALLSFVESAPRAYRLKASNAATPFSTSAGAFPFWNSFPDSKRSTAVVEVFAISDQIKKMLMRWNT
jgi:hypothetical protein